MEQCMALYDYLANQDEELSIRKNEKLTLLDSSKTWWRVQNAGGSIGYVPSNYCKKIDTPAPAPVAQPAASTPIKHTAVKDEAGMYQQVDMTFNKKPTKVVAIVKYPYAATREDELTLNKGEQVTVIEKEGDGWWNGEVNGACGWFPSNYVEETTIPDPTPEPTIQNSVAQTPAEPTVICRVRALYAFQSGNHEELSFERGNMMDIIDQPENDPDWWEARKSDGSTGLVPRNYVEVVHDDPPVQQKPAFPAAGPAGAGMGGGAAKPQLPVGRSFENRPWFHGKMSRNQCEGLLARARDGDFLVRESESKAGDYSISMKSPGKIKHFRIQSLPGGQYGIGPRKFTQIEELVDHYTKAHIYTAEDGTRMYLQHAFPKY
ncbi:SH2/SH3 adapter protein NCK1-like [Sycon ciliatum]|uniref:SH2/SH3 adapter protein NCK1-like n=1 Tax=Sycon ciliatum TaxID=27933 RepID=UPI0031F644C3